MPAYVLPTLLLGSRGDDVRKLQGYLRTLGFPVAQDAVFGPETRQAVINFQAQSGVPMDGIVGPRTWEAIEVNLGANVDVGGPDQAPPGAQPPEESSSMSIVAWGLALAGIAGLLYSDRSRS